MEYSTLNNLKLNQKARLYRLDTSPDLKKRLMDMGLVEGTDITRLFSTADEGISAYLARGSVIALRRCDAEKILTTACGVML
jgi:ferrous iron transport protein A